MACLLKIPDGSTKGVISFTTPEEIKIRESHVQLEKLKKLKERYVVCLHYNWHVYDAKPDDLFDVHFCGKEDIRVTNGNTIRLYEYDACNFTKRSFYPPKSETIPNLKHWDILFVARAVFFKGIPEFLLTIRELYDSGLKPRVLFICPMPPRGESKKHVLYDLWDDYDKMFNDEEKSLFNLMVLRDRYPFFFDRETLAHFYRSSKIFVHTAPDERRCRVAAYAWCCGLPVVGMENIAAILPPDLRVANAFLKAESFADFGLKIREALSLVQKQEPAFNPEPFLDHLSEDRMSRTMISNFHRDFGVIQDEGLWFLDELDIRLGRHHCEGRVGPNTLAYSIEKFMDDLSSAGELKALQADKPNDPEKSLERRHLQEGQGFFQKIKQLLC